MITALLLTLTASSPIKADKVVTFFPTTGYIDPDGFAALPIHGWIYEPEYDSFLRRQTLELLRKALELEPEDAATKTFKERAAYFLVDNERGKKVPIRIGDLVFVMEESSANGHFIDRVKLPLDQAMKLRDANGWIHYRAVTRDGDDRVFAGRVQLILPTGWSVISDIDDTIKISEVRQKKALLANTFLKEFQPVPGMPELFQAWQAKGAAFHYVSASPWQLYVPLAQFQEQHRFPAGSWHLKEFRWKDSSFVNLFQSPEKYKPRVIEPILKAYPKRQFICVGDSGEKDPEIYADLARRYPDQIIRILIRDVTNEAATAERYRQAFAGLPKERWHIFTEPKEIPAIPGLN